MKLLDSPADYSSKEKIILEKQLKSWVKKFNSTTDFLLEQIKNPTEIDSDENNIIYIDMRPVTEFEKLKDAELTFKQVFLLFSSWNDILQLQAARNVGKYKNKKVVAYIQKLWSVVSVFKSFFYKDENPTEPLSS